MKTKAITFLALLLLIINGAVYTMTELNGEQRVQLALEKKLKNLQTHYEILLQTQKTIALAIYKSTLNYDRLIQIMSEANDATKEKKALLRDELKKLLTPKYKIAKEQGVLQYQFLLPNNESFLRMHKPSKFGDNLTDIRDDFKYTNETKKPIRGFTQGRTTHAFRNTFPLFDKSGNHIGAMEISFSSDNFQHYLTNVSHIHTHFLVNKKIFFAKTWERDDLMLKYAQSAENLNYMVALEGIHTKEKCIVENSVKLEPVREEIDSKMLQGDMFSSYVQHYDNVDVFSFLPIKNLKDETVAWLVSYEESPFIQSTFKNMLIIRIVTFLFSLILIYFIAQQIRSKQSIDLLHERMELALKGSNDGVWDWNLLDNSVYFSPRWKEMLGYRDSELPNELSIWKDHVHPDDLEGAMTNIQMNIEGKTAYYENPYRLKHKDGHWVWIQARGKTQYDADGKAIRMIGTHTDITQEHHMKEEVQKFQAVLENAPISIVITDLHGTIEYVNPWFTTITGYTSEEAIGKNPRILKTEHSKPDEYGELWSTITHDKSWSGIFENQKKNGEHYWESAIIAPVHNSEGEVINYLGIKEEITKEVHLQQQLKEKEEMMIVQSRQAAMGEMISMIAHQWRQPLGAIAATAIDLKIKIELETFDLQTKEGQDACNEYFLRQLNDIGHFVQNLTTTIDDFRNFYKPNKETVSVTLKAVMAKALNIIKTSLENDNVEIIYDYHSREELELHDSEMIQVILNILRNAQDNFKEKGIALKDTASHKKPQIKISTRERSIEICDNGGGIPKEIIGKIFDPYFTTKDAKNGTGLGLYMSKIIVEKHHNGKLNAENQDDGVCFRIELLKKELVT